MLIGYITKLVPRMLLSFTVLRTKYRV
ncbi:UNVERIFIED_CONTAM: hypothetical protein GTU68_030259 [Idotea baltica]|nr:hypothetical protein [Idotea baltica]